MGVLKRLWMEGAVRQGVAPFLFGNLDRAAAVTAPSQRESDGPQRHPELGALILIIIVVAIIF